MKRKLKTFRCEAYYNGKLIASDIIEGVDIDIVDENARNSFIEWLEFKTVELDEKGNPKLIKID